MQPLRKYAKSLLKLIIAAYLLVAMGVFSWLPVIILNFDQAHQATGQDSGNVVSWIVHHTTDDVHSQKSVNHDAHHATILHETPDHLLKLPSDDFIKYMLKVALQFEMITVMSALILLWVFLPYFEILSPSVLASYPFLIHQ